MNIHHWYVVNKSTGEKLEDNIESHDLAKLICDEENRKDEYEWGLENEWEVRAVYYNEPLEPSDSNDAESLASILDYQ